MNVINFSRIFSRNYAIKTDLKIKWVRPERIPCYKPAKSGDLAPVDSIDTKSEFPLHLRDSKELETADETIKKLFSLEFAPYQRTREVLKERMKTRVRRHPLDNGSMEVRIARMTAHIRILQQKMEQEPRNTKAKVHVKELIDRRKKFLKFLRRWDYKRFEWLLEKLDLVYKPIPALSHYLSRKESLRKLTDKFCDEMKDQRLAEYRRQLEAQQEDFLRTKLNKLEFIRREQELCGIPITIDQRDIEETRKMLDELVAAKKNSENQPKES